MAKYIVLSFLLLLTSKLLCQTTSTDSISLPSDSVIYVYDTVYSTNTVQKVIYGEPTYYNLAGIKIGGGESWIRAQNHSNPKPTNYSELFCSFSRGRFLFSTGFGVNSFGETVQYSTKRLNITSSSYSKLDTISKYGQIIGRDTTFTYITKLNQYTKTDTQKIVDNHRITNQIRSIYLPLHFGYYIKTGYFRINVNMGIIPSYIVFNSLGESQTPFIISNKRKYSVAMQPTIEATYWLFSHIFTHISCSFYRTILPYQTNDAHNVNINSTLFDAGISFLFFDKKFDKKRE